jgi:signal transduction histidine kinase
LLLQAAVWMQWSALPLSREVLIAAVVTATCAWVAFHGVRRALRSLAVQAARLQESAIGWDPARAVRMPSLATSDPSLRALESLRSQLLARFEQEQQLRKQVDEASAFKTGFLRSVRHELRTPLNAVLGFSEVLLSGMEGPLTAGQRENLQVIERTGRRLADLFDEVIELASMAAGQLELRADAVDALALLEAVGEALEEERGTRAVHIRIDEPKIPLTIAGDGERLQRLLRGVASQALSVLHGEELVLSATPAGESIRLCVLDSARKLTADERESLLGGAPTELRRKGLDESSRLRIALWRQLASLVGGTIELHSDDGGTRFVLELPVWRRS